MTKIMICANHNAFWMAIACNHWKSRHLETSNLQQKQFSGRAHVMISVSMCSFIQSSTSSGQ